jgi:hypothetical protein
MAHRECPGLPRRSLPMLNAPKRISKSTKSRMVGRRAGKRHVEIGGKCWRVISKADRGAGCVRVSDSQVRTDSPGLTGDSGRAMSKSKRRLGRGCQLDGQKSARHQRVRKLIVNDRAPPDVPPIRCFGQQSRTLVDSGFSSALVPAARRVREHGAAVEPPTPERVAFGPLVLRNRGVRVLLAI